MTSQTSILSANILSDGYHKKQSLIIRISNEVLEQDLTVSKIKDFIPYIFNELKNSMEPNEVWVITIENLKDNEINVKVAGKSYKVVKGENIQNAKVNLKILNTTPLQTQREKLTTWGGIALLFNKKPALKYIPLVGWMLGVVWGLIFPPKQDPLRPLKRHEFAAAFGEPTPQKFLDYLKLVQTQIESQKRHHSRLLGEQENNYVDKLHDETTSSYQNGAAIQAALKSPHQHRAINDCSNKFADEIANLKEDKRLSYPLGYYKDGHYVPMLLTFYKKGEVIKGQLMHMETSDSDKFNPLQLFEITKDNIPSLFQQLIPFQTPPQKNKVSNEASALGAIEDLMSLESKAAYKETEIAAEKELYEKAKNILNDLQGKEGCTDWKWTLRIKDSALSAKLETKIPFSTVGSTYAEIFKKLDQSIEETDRKLSDVKIAQGKRASEFKVDMRDPATIILSIIKQKTTNLKASDKVKTRSKDWTKLVTRAMEERDQKSFSFFKLSFETNFVFHLIQSQLESLSANSKLSFSQKSEQLNELKSKMTHLEKQLKKEYGTSQPLEILWQDSPDGLQRLIQIKEEIQKYEIVLSQQRFNELNVGKIQSAPWQAEIPIKEGIAEKNREKVTAIQLQEQIIGLTNSLKQQIGQKQDADAGAITTSLEQIIHKLNQLNTLQAYSESIAAANSVLEALPNVGDSFWNNFPADQMHLLSRAISSVTQTSWEAHIRLNQTHVWPNHLINFLNAQAILYDLLQRRRVEVCKKIPSDVAEEFIESIKNDHKKNLIRQKQRAWYKEQSEWNKKNPDNKKTELFTLPAVTFYLCENPGAIAKKANLTKAELACLFMETPAPYTSKQDQIHQLKHLLTQHPYYRFGRNPAIETRALNLVKHYEEKEALEEVKWLGTLFGTEITTTNVLVLDSYRNAEEYKVYLDGIFLANYQAALEKYDGTQTTEKDIWKSGWEHSDKTKDNFLPPELIDIRRFNVFLQTMLHPESTIKRGFANKLQQVSWAIGIVKEGAKGAVNYEDKMRRAGIAEEKERRALIDALGTFRLKPGESAEEVGDSGHGPAIHITDSRGKVLLEYQPTGPLFNDFRDPFHDRGLIGSEEVISKQWAVDRVYTDDTPKDLAQKAREQHTREQETTNRVTEVTLIADEKKQPSTDLTDEQNARLRTLVVHSGMNETGTEAIATQTFLNAMEFIFDYPSLLEREDVQRKLELTLYSSGLINNSLSENAYYFTHSQFGERLAQTIERMMDEKRYRSAAFLTLFSKHMVDHIHQYSDPEKAPVKVKELISPVAKQIRPNEADWQKHLDKLFEFAISGNLDPGARKSLFTALLAVWQDQFAEIPHRDLAQHIPLLAQIFIAYGYILNTPEESGDPALQNSLLDFVRGHVIPAVSTLFLDPTLKNNLLNAVAKQGIERKEINVNWENTASQFIFKSDKMEINLLTGQVNAEVNQGVGNTSFLPKTVLKNPVYAKLFGDFNPEAKLQYKQEKNLQTVYEYSFQKGGHAFTVKYHPQKATVDVYQTIHAKQYRYIPALSSGETIPKDLVERFGIWQEVGAPLNALIITKKVDEWKNEDKLVVKLRREDRSTYHVAEVKTTREEKVLSPDEAKEFLNIFGFAAPHNSVFVRNRHGLSEVHFLDLGVSIRKTKDGRWAGTGRWQGYVLVTHEKKVRHLMERMGTHYDQFMLAMEHKNRTTGVVKTQCFLKPMHFQSPSARSEKHERQAIDETSYEIDGLPSLSLTFESGKTVGSEGQMKSSAGGFATLAYSAFVNKNYEKALQFLTRAKEERLGPNEADVLEKIADHIHAHKDPSFRGIAFRLKAKLMLSHIEQFQLNKKAFRPHNWELYQLKLQDDIKLFQDYERRLRNNDKAAEKYRLADGLKLSDQEIQEYARITREGFLFLIQNRDDKFRQPPAVIQPKDLQRVQIAPQMISEFAGNLCRYAERPVADNPKMDLNNLSPYPSFEDLVVNFYAFAEQIKDKNVQPTDPCIINLTNLSLGHLPIEQARQVEVARQLLLTLAYLNADESVKTHPFQYDDTIFNSIETIIKPNLRLKEFSAWRGVYTQARIQFSRTKLGKKFGPTLYQINRLQEKVSAQLYPLLTSHNTMVQKANLTAAFDKPTTANQKPPEKEKNLFTTTLDTIRREIENPSSLFTSEEKLAWELLCTNMSQNVSEDSSKTVLELIGSLFAMDYHAAASRHAAEVAKDINYATGRNVQRPSAAPKQTAVYQSQDEDIRTHARDFLKRIEEDFYEEPVKTTRDEIIGRNTRHQQAATKIYDIRGKMSEMQREEFNKMKSGIDLAIKLKITAIDSHAGIVKEKKLRPLRLAIIQELIQTRDKASELQQDILETLSNNPKLSPAIRKMLENPEQYGREEIFERILDLYRSNHLRAENESAESKATLDVVESKITRFLYEATAAQQLTQALTPLESLEQQAQKGGIDAITWAQTSNQLYGFISNASKKDRYLEKDSMHLQAPQFSRKHLIAEYRSEKVARSYQPEVIEKLVNNRNALILLDPGAGKSKVIFPETAYLIAETLFAKTGKHVLPVILVTEEMIGINQRDMDESTREMYKQASHLFDLTRGSPKDLSFLVDEYKRLDEAKKSGGYLITSISNLAALNNELGFAAQELRDKVEEAKPVLRKFSADIDRKKVLKNSEAFFEELLNKMSSDDEAIKVVKELIELQQKRHWLMKIYELLHTKEEVRYIADEVDDVFSINRKYNYSQGEPQATNEDLRVGIHDAMSVIFTSKNADLQKLSILLSTGGQENLKGTNLEGEPKTKKYITALAEAIYNLDETSPLFGLSVVQWNDIKNRFESKEQFVNFVTGIPGNRPKNLVGDKEDVNDSHLKYLSVLKHLCSITLPNILPLKAGYDYGLEVKDGCTVVPKKEGQDLDNVRFSDEYEIVAFQYMYYSSAAPRFDYFKTQWLSLQDKLNKEIKEKKEPASALLQWYRGANVSELNQKEELIALYKHLSAPESWYIRYELLKEDVLKNKVKVSPKQIQTNSQDPLREMHVAGASGTMNPYGMPEGFEHDSSVSDNARKVEADIHLKLGVMNEDKDHPKAPQGLEALVKKAGKGPQAHKEFLLKKMKDSECQFIINQEGIAGGSNIYSMIDLVRNAKDDHGKPLQRDIFFKDPKKGQMYWAWDKAEPEPLIDQKITKNDLVLFSSSDVRGTDFVMPSGKGVLIAGPTMKDYILAQAFNRARQAGEGQDIDIYVPDEFVESAKETLGLEKGEDFKLTHFLKIVKLNSITEKENLNFQAQCAKVDGIVPHAVKQLLFKPYISDEQAYFKIDKDDLSNFKQIFADICFDAALFEVTEDVFVKHKKIDFAAELQDVKEEQTLDVIQRRYSEQREKANNLQRELEDKLIPVDKKVLALFNDLTGQNLTPSDLLKRVDVFEKRVEDLEKKMKDLTNEKDGLIKIKEEEFKENKQFHLQNLNQTILSSALVGQGDQEQAQEQQQQQQLQQQMMSVQESSDADGLSNKPKHKWKYWYTSEESGDFFQRNEPWIAHSSSKLKPITALAHPQTRKEVAGENSPWLPSLQQQSELDCGFDPAIRMTVNYKEIVDQFKTRSGNVMGRIAIMEHQNHTNDPAVVLMDKYDYERVFNDSVNYINSSKNETNREWHLTILHLSPQVENDPVVINSTDTAVQMTDKHKSLLAQVKVFAGQIIFKPEEEKLIKLWLDTTTKEQKINLMKFLNKIHNVSSVTQIADWKQSPLSKHLGPELLFNTQ